ALKFEWKHLSFTSMPTARLPLRSESIFRKAVSPNGIRRARKLAQASVGIASRFCPEQSQTCRPRRWKADTTPLARRTPRRCAFRLLMGSRMKSFFSIVELEHLICHFRLSSAEAGYRSKLSTRRRFPRSFYSRTGTEKQAIKSRDLLGIRPHLTD